jgi:hypothetical protein
MARSNQVQFRGAGIRSEHEDSVEVTEEMRMKKLLHVIQHEFHQDRIRCSRLIDVAQREVARLKRRSGYAFLEEATSILRAYRALLRQDKGYQSAPGQVLDEAKKLGDLGNWRLASYLVFVTYNLFGSQPDFDDLKNWCRWILRIVPEDRKTEYRRVVCLLLMVYYETSLDRSRAVWMLLRASGDIPPEYRSKRLSVQFVLFGEWSSEIASDSQSRLAKGLLSSVSHFNEEERLMEEWRCVCIFPSRNGSDEYYRNSVARLSEYAASKGFVALAVMFGLEYASTYCRDADPTRYIELLERYLGFGMTQCSLIHKMQALILATLFAKRLNQHRVLDYVKMRVRRLKKLKNLFLQQKCVLAELVFEYRPRLRASTAREIFSNLDLIRTSGRTQLIAGLGATMAEYGYCPLLQDGTPWLIDAMRQTESLARRSSAVDRVKMSMLVESIAHDVEVSRNESDNSGKQRTLSIAAARHDLKYHVRAVRSQLDEMKTKSVKRRDVESLADRLSVLKSVFYPIQKMPTIDTVIKLIDAHIATSSQLNQQREMNYDISHVPRDVKLAILDEELFSSGLFNVILNAFRHGAEGTPITIECNVTADRFAIKVTNATTGLVVIPDHDHDSTSDYRDIKRNSHGFGLVLIKRMLAETGATVSFDAQPTELCVAISVPLSFS